MPEPMKDFPLRRTPGKAHLPGAHSRDLMLSVGTLRQKRPMRNIPADLLRTFITIVDLRGYTRAGERLGRSQPAISLQMKRLQELVDVQLFDKDSGDGQLTEAGEVVAGYARRILNLNDEMMLKLARRDLRGKIRIGIPNDYADHFLPGLLENFAEEHDQVSFDVVCDVSQNLLKDFRAGLYDIVVAMTPDSPAEGAFMSWREPLTWVGEPHNGHLADSEEPVRIVCYPEGCLYRRNMLSALQREARAFDIVYTSPSLAGIEAAVSRGFGVTALAKRITSGKLRPIPPDYNFPALSDLVVGIYLPEGAVSGGAQSLAARLADAFASLNTRDLVSIQPRSVK